MCIKNVDRNKAVMMLFSVYTEYYINSVKIIMLLCFINEEISFIKCCMETICTLRGGNVTLGIFLCGYPHTCHWRNKPAQLNCSSQPQGRGEQG